MFIWKCTTKLLYQIYYQEDTLKKQYSIGWFTLWARIVSKHRVYQQHQTGKNNSEKCIFWGGGEEKEKQCTSPRIGYVSTRNSQCPSTLDSTKAGEDCRFLLFIAVSYCRLYWRPGAKGGSDWGQKPSGTDNQWQNSPQPHSSQYVAMQRSTGKSVLRYVVCLLGTKVQKSKSLYSATQEVCDEIRNAPRYPEPASTGQTLTTEKTCWHRCGALQFLTLNWKQEV